MKSKLRVGFLTTKDPMDKRSWSGIYYRMFLSLKGEFEEVVPLGPVDALLPKIIFKIFNVITKSTVGKKYNYSHSSIYSKVLSEKIENKLKKHSLDVIFAPSGSTQIAYLKTKIPICYYADTTFSQIHNYYENFSDLLDFSFLESDEIERKAIQKSRAIVFPSSWAAEHAVSYYNQNVEKTFVVPMGANIDHSSPSFANDLEKKLKNPEFQLLFLGVDWERKGGHIVFDTLLKLIEKGVNVKLVVCGCVPPLKHPKMEVIPFLNKNKKEDADRFDLLLRQSHLLFLPTRAECFGVVFCEASAYGIPSITTETGGVKGAVENGVNGYALPYEAGSDIYANLILKLINNVNEYRALCLTSINKFNEELNWLKWGKNMKVIFEQLNENNIEGSKNSLNSTPMPV